MIVHDQQVAAVVSLTLNKLKLLLLRHDSALARGPPLQQLPVCVLSVLMCTDLLTFIQLSYYKLSSLFQFYQPIQIVTLTCIIT